MSVSTDVERGLIGVGGGPYSLLLPRSKDFGALGSVLKARYPDPLAIGALFSAFQLLWDRAEPMGYVNAMTTNPFPATPSHRVIFHYGRWTPRAVSGFGFSVSRYFDATRRRLRCSHRGQRAANGLGLGDAQVSWLGCQTLARSTGQISMFQSNAREGNETFFGYVVGQFLLQLLSIRSYLPRY